MRCAGWVLVGIVMLTAGCGGESERGEAARTVRDDDRLSVYVVNYPLRYFAERIGGDLVRVEFPAPPEVDPALWMPEAAIVAAYQAADVILLNGAGYAGWVDKVTLPDSKLVDTSESARDRYLEVDDVVVHSHGPEGGHNHGSLAFTTWLDPTLAVEQARAVRDAFAAARPERADALGERFDSLQGELVELDRRIGEIVSAGADRPLLGSHPVYQYLAQRYGLDLESVHFEPDEFPDQQGWRELRELLAEHPARWMLWEGQPLGRTADRLRELGVESVVFDPCGNVPEAGGFLDVMRGNVESLERAFLS
jgi:zinc transport system substrate-binding protein